MAVLIEAVNVLVRNATIERRLPDGLLGWARLCPNSMYCTDGELFRIGFLCDSDAFAFVEELIGLGFSGRTHPEAAPAHIRRGDVQARFQSLLEELGRLGGIEDVEVGDYRGDLNAAYDRAKQLVRDTGGNAGGPLQLLGVAARLLERWDEAESHFRRVTELAPEFIGGWLELTWTLSAQGRPREAEETANRAVALDPTDAGALGNLAVSLHEQGRHEEALEWAKKAVAAKPEDEKNRYLLGTIRKALQKDAQAEP